MPLRCGEASIPEPDLAVIAGPLPTVEETFPTSAILVIEISDSSLGYDRIKSRIYAAAGVAEYWIANLRDNTFEVYRRPSPAPQEVSESPATAPFAAPIVFKPADRIAPLAVPTAAILISELLP